MLRKEFITAHLQDLELYGNACQEFGNADKETVLGKWYDKHCLYQEDGNCLMHMLHISTPYKFFHIDITLTSHVTVVTGDSGTGKSLLYEALPDTIDNVKVRRFTYDGELFYIAQEIKNSANKLFVFDRTEYLFLNEGADEFFKAVNSDKDNYFLFLGRDTGKLNIQLQDLKTLIFKDKVLSFLN